MAEKRYFFFLLSLFFGMSLATWYNMNLFCFLVEYSLEYLRIITEHWLYHRENILERLLGNLSWETSKCNVNVTKLVAGLPLVDVPRLKIYNLLTSQNWRSTSVDVPRLKIYNLLTSQDWRSTTCWRPEIEGLPLMTPQDWRPTPVDVPRLKVYPCWRPRLKVYRY